MADPYFNDVALLLLMNGADGSTTFTDSSSNGFTATVIGSVQIDTAQSKFGGAAALFDGSGDYIEFTDPALAVGTEAFTVECWVRITSYPSATYAVASTRDSLPSDRAWTVFIHSSGNVYFRIRGANIYQAETTTSPISLNTWHHIAAVKEANGDMTVYVDGVAGSVTDTYPALALNQSDVYIGAFLYPGFFRYMDGWIDDFRLTKGVARYTSNFTPPTAAFPDAFGDPHYNDVSLLLLMNGADGSTTFTDSSSNAHTVTANGNAQIDTAHSKYGGASALFINSDRLEIPDDASLRLEGADFTMECWVRFDSVSGRRTLASKWVGNIYTEREFIWRLDGNNNEIDFVFEDDATNTVRTVSHPWSPSTGVWYHVALVRNGNDFEHFVDGVSLGSPVTFNYTIYSDASAFVIGLQNNGTVSSYVGVNPMDGWIDDFRLTKGVARYTSNFTPPTEELPTSGSSGGGPINVAVGQATGTDSALSITPQILVGVSVGQASETDSALPITRRDIVKQAVETDSALSIAPLYPPRFTDPVSVTDDAGTVVTFSITDIDDPVGDATYQWYDQNGAIDSATDATYQRELAPEDDGEAVYVIVTNSVGSRQSADATMTVNTTDSGVGDIAPITYRLRFGTYREPFYKNGTVILSRPLAEGESLSIERKTPITKDISFTFLEEPDWNAFEYQIDKYTMICQEIEGHLCECLECIVPAVTLSANIVPTGDNFECVPGSCSALTTAFPGWANLVFEDKATTDPEDVFPINTGWVQLYPTRDTIISDGWDEPVTRLDLVPDSVEPFTVCGETPNYVLEVTQRGGDALTFNNRCLWDYDRKFIQSSNTCRGSGAVLFRDGAGVLYVPENRVMRITGEYKFEYKPPFTSSWFEGDVTLFLGAGIDLMGSDQARLYVDSYEQAGGGSNPRYGPLFDIAESANDGEWCVFVFNLKASFTQKERANGSTYIEIDYDCSLHFWHYYEPDGEWRKESFVYSKIVEASIGSSAVGYQYRNLRLDYEPGTIYGDPTPSSMDDGDESGWFWGGGKYAGIYTAPEAFDEDEFFYAFLRNRSEYVVPEYCENVLDEELTVSPALPSSPIATIQPGDQVTLTATVTAGTPPFTYQWYKDDVAVEGETDSTYSFVLGENDVGSQFKVIVSNACGETSGLNETTGETFVVLGE